jgi:hypothetical protein
MKPGPKPMLENKELLKKIKDCVLDGMNLKETARVSGINEDTFYVYHSDNVLGIADKIEGWRRDRKLRLANDRMEEILQLNPKDKEYTRSVLDASKFTLETLDKQNYSKRSELTGADGKDLPTPIMNVQRDNSNNEDQSTEQKD